jgi:ABC-type uncharacterized transport system permease subunit
MVSTLAAVIGLIAVASYSAGTLLQVRTYRNNTRGSSGVLLAAAAFGAVLHGVANYLIVYSGGKLYLGIQTSLSLVSWIMLVILLLANLRLPLSNLLILVLPVAIVGVISLLTAPPESGLHLATLGDPLIWHIFVSIVAYSVMFMAACQSVLLAVVEHRLKHKRTRLLRLLPPLQTMETLLFDLLWAGIVVLTMAVASGFFFLDDMFEQRVVHHTVLTLASWVLYAVLLAGHHVLGWRGTTAVRWTLIAFSLLVLGYFGSKFVIEVLLEN